MTPVGLDRDAEEALEVSPVGGVLCWGHRVALVGYRFQAPTQVPLCGFMAQTPSPLHQGVGSCEGPVSG